MIICFIRGALTTRLCGMLKTNAAAWRFRRLHNVSTAFAQRAPRRFAFFKRCVDAVRTPHWCDRGLRHNVKASNV